MHHRQSDADQILDGLPLHQNLDGDHSAYPTCDDRHLTAPTGYLHLIQHPSAHLDLSDWPIHRCVTERLTTYLRYPKADHGTPHELVLRCGHQIHLGLLGSSIGQCVGAGLDWTSLEG